MTTRQPLVFFGSGAFGVPTLEAICREHDVRAVVTQPDRPAGRGGSMTPTPVAQWIAAHRPDIPVVKPERVNDPEVVGSIRAHGAGIFVVIAFGQKMGRTLLEGIDAMNLHASLLPRWRGAAPINAAILAGDTVTGNSVITLADRMDAGRVLGQSERQIEPAQTAGELHDLLATDGPALVLRVIDEVSRGACPGREQDESKVTKASKLSRDDGWVDFGTSAELCRRRVHGLTPWPGVSVGIVGEQSVEKRSLKLLRVQAVERRSEEDPGTLVDAAAGTVACAGGSGLRLLEVQAPGKKPMNWAEFQRGRQLAAGTKFLGREHQGSDLKC